MINDYSNITVVVSNAQGLAISKKGGNHNRGKTSSLQACNCSV
jgi:hypothetical protein